MASSSTPDQLDMQIEMARRKINRSFDELKQSVARWEPRMGVTFHIDIPHDQDRIYGDEWRKFNERTDT